MNKIHELKLREWFADDVLSGRKRIEVRINDRCYQTGDFIKFVPVGRIVMEDYDGRTVPSRVDMENKLYRITYIETVNIAQGYVAFSFEEVEP